MILDFEVTIGVTQNTRSFVQYEVLADFEMLSAPSAAKADGCASIVKLTKDPKNFFFIKTPILIFEKRFHILGCHWAMPKKCQLKYYLKRKVFSLAGILPVELLIEFTKIGFTSAFQLNIVKLEF
jgi:hypothetical protein